MTRSQAKIDIGARGDAELVVQPLAPVDAEHEHELTRRVEQRGLGARAHGDRQRALSVGPDEAREQRRLELVDLGRGRGAAAVRLQPARDDAERRVQQRRVGRAARPRRRAAPSDSCSRFFLDANTGAAAAAATAKEATAWRSRGRGATRRTCGSARVARGRSSKAPKRL